MPERVMLVLAVSIVALCAASGAHAKKCSRFVTAEMRANVAANVEKFDWAAEEQAKAVKAAEKWVQRSDEELWAMVTSQWLPRALITNKGVFYKGKRPGCPNCGEAAPLKYGTHGNQWWTYRDDPDWKLLCRNCGEVFPKNDFGAFYESALDEHGFFRRELGDQSLLFNAEHPDPKDPLHKLYVDDGYGMVDEKGNVHHIIAFRCSLQWGVISRALGALAQAYALTSDRRYAHKAAVLLDRIADVYPDMDYRPLHDMGFQHSQGGAGEGRIGGCICETYYGERLCRPYDLIYDGLQGDDELVSFCSRVAKQYKLGDKSTTEAICRHIEDHLLLEILKSVKDGRVRGNVGMDHTCLAYAAVALDRAEITKEWLDWLFDPDYPGDYTDAHLTWRKKSVPWVLAEGLDRDGMGGEVGSYGFTWTRKMIELAEILSAYPDYTEHDLAAEYPKLRQALLVEPRVNVLDATVPNIGDHGATGRWRRTGRGDMYMLGYKLYQDPRLAELAWHEHKQHEASLRLWSDVYQPDPDALIREAEQMAGQRPFRLKCDHLGRYGQAVLQTEHPADGRALWVSYGYGLGHGHADSLNIDLYAKNVEMLPELGYPEFTGSWPKRRAWTSNTISHNTLQVNDTRCSGDGGKIVLFAVAPPLRAIAVAAPATYPDLRTYCRSVAMVDVSDTDSYVFDVFRARGGKNHRLSYHGPAETASVEGLSLVKQENGTFAGPDVPFAKLDGEQADFYRESGFTYLYDVERSRPGDTYYTVDWKCEDLRGRIEKGKEPHLRLHALTPCDEVALGSGDPPQLGRGVPRRLRYLIQSRLGEDVESQFVTVLEPYDTTPFITQVRKLQVEHDADPNSVAAVAVELLDGTTDILISCEDRVAVKVEGGIEFDGQFGMIRLINGEVKLMRMSNATLLKLGEVALKAEVAAYEGTVTAIDISDPMNNTVSLDPPLPEGETLIGKVIHFQNDLPLDTSYDIKAVTGEKVSTGDITIIRRFKDNEDFEAGYECLANPGDSYIVPCHYKLER